MLGAARTAWDARAWAPTSTPAVNPRRTTTAATLSTITFSGYNGANYSTAKAEFGAGAADLTGSTQVLYYNSYDSSSTGGGWPTGTGDFCIEGWIWKPAARGTATTGDLCALNVSGGLGIRFGSGYNSGGFNHMQVWARGQADMDYCDFTWPDDTWCHFAVQRKSANVTFWANGNKIATAGGSGAGTRNFTSGTAQLTIGSYDNGGTSDETIKSWLDEICVSNSWRYDDTYSTYTIPTAAFTVDTITNMLIHFDSSLTTAAT
jgi:hypothetical protein